MFWKKKEEPPFPKEYLDDLKNIRVKYTGTVDSKPVIKYYGTALPWDLESNMERDHGHSTSFSVDGQKIEMKGPVFIKKGEEVTVWGKYDRGVITAVQMESPDFVFRG